MSGKAYSLIPLSNYKEKETALFLYCTDSILPMRKGQTAHNKAGGDVIKKSDFSGSKGVGPWNTR